MKTEEGRTLIINEIYEKSIDHKSEASVTPRVPLLHINPYTRWIASTLTKVQWLRVMTPILTLGAIVSACTTYLVITQSDSPFGPNPKTVIGLMLINLTLLLAISVIVSRQLFKLWVERRRGSVGSRLQTRIIVTFCFLSAIPTIVVAVFSTLFFNYGIQSWFDDRIGTALEESVAVAEAYLQEHKEVIRADISAMARELERPSYPLVKTRALLSAYLTKQANDRSLTEAIIFHGRSREILAKNPLSFAYALERSDESNMKLAAQGHIVVITDPKDTKVQAIVKLDQFVDSYLMIGRFIDSKVLHHIQQTKGAVHEYADLKNSIANLQVEFSFIFLMVAVLLLLVAVWIGMMFSIELVHPISDMVSATQAIKKGDYTVRVEQEIHHQDDELGTLSRAFNQMVEQLGLQREEVISAQRSKAWSEIARRIAHEIKNPLTPIHLAAERLRKKYRGSVKDQEDFDRYTETIIRHVNHIGRMIDEFVHFARMPNPEFTKQDMCKLLREAVFSQECAEASVRYFLEVPDTPIILVCDGGQIQQAISNVCKNAVEAIKSHGQEDGEIHIILNRSGDKLTVSIIDNGPGFPKELLKTLTEPYVTTRPKGTGLGLAIVKKIIEDHKGRIELMNRKHGTCVQLTFILPQTIQETVKPRFIEGYRKALMDT